VAKATRARARTMASIGQDEPQDQVLGPEEPALSGEVGKTALLPAYRTYLDGRKGLAQAFREREQRDQEAYKDAERRYHLCEQAIDRAVKARERAELDASEAYKEELDKAVEKASQTYKEKTKQALIECKQKVVDAWKSSTETSGDMTGVSEEQVDKAMKAREKAEVDALLAYRLEVDRAVDRASQAYKDEVKLALEECRKSVMEAWRTSMEASARMTGVFEEDKSIEEDEQPAANSPSAQTMQLRELAQNLKSGFFSTMRKARRALQAGARS
jgi:hypothetical protein